MQLPSQIAATLTVLCAATTSAQQGAIQPTSAIVQSQGTGSGHPLEKPIKIGQTAVARANELTDYTAVLYRNMWLGNGYSQSTVHVKGRTRPFSVYLYFEQPSQGREVLFVEGWNQNKLLAHEGSGPLSLIGSVSLDPNGAQAMSGNKYPITKLGLDTLAQAVVDQWQQEMQLQPADQVEVKLYPEARLGKEDCKVVETIHKRRVQGLRFHKTRLFLQKDTNVPFAVQQFAFPSQQGAAAPKVEDVRYQQLQINVGLTQQDFDPRNPAYKF